MKNHIKKYSFLIFLIFVSGQLLAALELKKHTINNAGSGSSSNRFELNSSMAQVDANSPIQTNRYELKSGFWQENTDLIFKNNFK